MKTRNLRLGTIAWLVALVMMAAAATTATASGSHPRATAAAAVTTPTTVAAPIRFDSAAGTFRGVFRPHQFSVVGRQLMATGTVSGNVTRTGQALQHVIKQATVPVELVNTTRTGPRTAAATRSAGAAAAAVITCNILNLVLGPLDLNLLGLHIHLDTVVLNIVANPAGGLLGQLLCSIAHLLDGGLAGIGGLLGLAALLNALLGALGL
jgi:hypothetical protein